MKDKMTYINRVVLALMACAALFPQCASSQTIRGDFNMDGKVNVSDAISMVNSLLNSSFGEVSTSDRDTLTVGDVQFVMVRVKPGTYSLQYGDVRTVESEFWIGQTEVTYGLWWAVMGREGYPSNEMLRNRPMQNVSWDDCQVFLDSLNLKTGRNFRLPTGDEWTFAASGGRLAVGYDYSGGNDIDEVAWYNGNYNPTSGSSNVATKAPNELGLYDMSGNVAEWGQEMNESTTTGTLIRWAWVHGGCWTNPAEGCRPTSSVLKDPTIKYDQDQFGFRLALSAGQ